MDLLLEGKRALVAAPSTSPLTDAIMAALAAEGADVAQAMSADADAGACDVLVVVAGCPGSEGAELDVLTSLLSVAAEAMGAAAWGRIVAVAEPCTGTDDLAVGVRDATLESAVRTLGMRWRQRGVGVNAVITADPHDNQNALERGIASEETASLVAFLCSPLAMTITGEALSPSGAASRTIRY